ncbi:MULTISPECIES: hypothetical protein [Cupriavidus]|uniref:hypothetical protein n=1 Tax=Cupriavidus sp. DF5525 TaxID=3160989 RepID=UPI0003B09867|nr:hypothetical protein N234_13305 [Ralstonia pickettii DTP0602]
MRKLFWRMSGIVAMTALVAALGGCAGGVTDGRESGITTYGTLDVGVSHTR